MRGIYTAGVLDAFMEQGLHFDGVIGVSAGAASRAVLLFRDKRAGASGILRNTGTISIL